MTELSEEVLRATLPGIYGKCYAPMNLEISIDAETDRITYYSLDDRYVRSGYGGWLEVIACSGATCQIIQHSNSVTEDTEEQLTLWTNPVAIRMTYAEWMRVAR